MTVSAPTRALHRALPLALGIWALGAWHLNFICDDAFISYRYAKHLAAGEGLVFNLGAQPPVEGYTNFLWVVYLSLFEPGGWLHTRILDTPTIARLTSALCGLLLLLSVAGHLRRREELTDGARVAGLLFLASFPPMALWSTGGLATMPAALFIFLTYRALFGARSTAPEANPTASAARWLPGLAAGLWGTLAVLTRADGFLWILGLILLALLSPQRRRSAFRRKLLVCALLTGGTLAAHFIWRHGFYGDWLPNTARVKTGLSALRLERGAKYVLAYLCAVPSAGLALGFGLYALRQGRQAKAPDQGAALPSAAARSQRPLAAQALLCFSGTAAYALWVGGDFMPLGRFLFPAVPFLALALAAGLARAQASPGAWGRRGAALGAGLAILLSGLAFADIHVLPHALRTAVDFRWNEPHYQTELEMRAGMDERARDWVVQGKALALYTRPDETMILSAVGAQGYHSNLFLYDNYGLVTRAVALRDAPLKRSSPGHDKRVPSDFFFDRKPDYLGSLLSHPWLPETDGLPTAPGQSWHEHPWGHRVDIERYPLYPEDGFEEGLELRLLRFKR